MCSGRQSRPHLFHVVRKVCTKSGHVSTIPPVVKNNSHHGISTIKSDYPNLYYLVDDRSVRIPLSKLVSVTQNGNEMELVKEAARPKPITFKFDDEQDARLMARIARACDFY